MSGRRRGPGRAGGPHRPRLTEEEEFAEFVRHVRANTAKMIDRSAYVMSLVPTADGVDVKFAVEMGLSIMMRKPIILIVRPDSDVPDKLRLIADAEVTLDDDFDTEDGQARIAEKVNEVLSRMGL